MKLCKDCEYATRKLCAHGISEIWECRHLSVIGHDRVSGTTIFKLCKDLREDNGKCGADAKLFEPRKLTFWSRLLGDSAPWRE
jgi:hypothetical protein